MSTVLIIVIVVAVVVVIGLLFAVTKGRRVAAERRQERELNRRREHAVSEHREAAEARTGRAEEAEHHARVASAVAERERAEARLHEETARSHELGLADEDLMRDDPATATRGRERPRLSAKRKPSARRSPPTRPGRTQIAERRAAMSTASSDPSIGDLVKQLSEQSSRLARQEVELAKAELASRARRPGSASACSAAPACSGSTDSARWSRPPCLPWRPRSRRGWRR